MSDPLVVSIARARADKLMATLRPCRRVLIVLADFCSTDEVAAGIGMAHLITTQLGIEAPIACLGFIPYPSNRELIRRLGIHIWRSERIDPQAFDGVLAIGNAALTFRLDGHVVTRLSKQPAMHPANFADDSQEVAALSSKVFHYHTMLQRQLPAEIATALLCGIEQVTQRLSSPESTPSDRAAYRALSAHADFALTHAIVSPAPTPEYVQQRIRAYRHAKLYGDVLIARLNQVYMPDIASMVADELCQIIGVRLTLIMALHAERLYLSLRTPQSHAPAHHWMVKIAPEAELIATPSVQGAEWNRPLVGLGSFAIRGVVSGLMSRLLRAADISQETRGESLRGA